MMIALVSPFRASWWKRERRPTMCSGLPPMNALKSGLLAGQLERLSDVDRAKQVLATMSGRVPIGNTMDHLARGDLEAAIDWYEKDLEMRRLNAPMVAFAGFLEPLRRGPRWAAVRAADEPPDAEMNLRRPDLAEHHAVWGNSGPEFASDSTKALIRSPEIRWQNLSPPLLIVLGDRKWRACDDGRAADQ
jgi:hypothetical protein